MRRENRRKERGRVDREGNSGRRADRETEMEDDGGFGFSDY